MTAEQKMQKIVEAAGEIWHKPLGPVSGESFGTYAPTVYWKCVCGKTESDECVNASPTDLNELFRLAETLGFESVLLDSGLTDNRTLCQTVRFNDNQAIDLQVEVFGATKPEALRDALYQSVKDLDA